MYRRCRVRILQPDIQYNYESMTISYNDNLNLSFTLIIDKNRIKIYTEPLKHYPKEIDTINYMIIYSIEPSMKEPLQTIPSYLRNKIILNRPTNKYNHRYFRTLNHKDNRNII